MESSDTRAVSFTLASTNTARPNSSDKNTITARVVNNDQLVSGVEVSLTVATSGATFDNGAVIMTGVTNPLGEFSASLVSSVTPVTVVGSCYQGSLLSASVLSKFLGSGSGSGNGAAELTGYVLQDNAIADGKTSNFCC